jgi:hypothetical protein
MARSRSPRKSLLDRLRAVLDRARERSESRRAFTCAGCDAPCCRVGRNGMLVTRLEAELIADALLADPELSSRLDELRRRIDEAIRRVGRIDLTEPPPTFDCPFLEEDVGCLLHGKAQPLGCITFMPRESGDCEHHVDLFEDAFDEVVRLNEILTGHEDREGTLLPHAVREVLRSRGRLWGTRRDHGGKKA